MNRKYTSADFLKLVEKLKNALPSLAITTDIMVGFPDETSADFNATLSVIALADFDFIYAFKYSPRPGTPASLREDSVARSVKEDRLAILLEQANGIATRKNAKLIDTQQEVLVEEVSADGLAYGRTRTNKKAYFCGNESQRGNLVTITITGSKINCLKGSSRSWAAQRVS